MAPRSTWFHGSPVSPSPAGLRPWPAPPWEWSAQAYVHPRTFSNLFTEFRVLILAKSVTSSSLWESVAFGEPQVKLQKESMLITEYRLKPWVSREREKYSQEKICRFFVGCLVGLLAGHVPHQVVDKLLHLLHVLLYSYMGAKTWLIWL